MFCGNCGNQIPEGEAICPVCGETAGAGLLPNEEEIIFEAPESAAPECQEEPAQPAPEAAYEPVKPAAEAVSEPVPMPAPQPAQIPAAEPAQNVSDADIVAEGSLSSKIWKKTGNAMDKLTLDKLRPVFLEDMRSNGVGLNEPLAMITDRDKKHEHELCEGSVGHISKAGANNVLKIYEETAANVPLKFIPEIRKNTLYIAHPRKPGIYIMMSYYFRNFEEEHMAELRQIAASLGAVSCAITIEEELPGMYYEEPEPTGLNLGGLFKRKKEAEEAPVEHEPARKVVYHDEVALPGGAPSEPALYWFVGNDSVKAIVMDGMRQKSRFADGVHNMSDTISMTSAKASSIDASAEELGFKANFTMFSQLEACKRSRIVVEMKY